MSPLKEYEPIYVEPKSWDNLEIIFSKGYEDSIGRLVRQIKSSDLSLKLYGTSSVYRLVISIYSPIEWNRETLHITFENSNQTWHFAYHSLPNQNPGYVRICDKENGIRTFNHVLEIINWK